MELTFTVGAVVFEWTFAAAVLSQILSTITTLDLGSANYSTIKKITTVKTHVAINSDA